MQIQQDQKFSLASLLSLCIILMVGFFVLCWFALIFSQVFDLFPLPFYHSCSLQSFPSVIATIWNKNDPSKGSGLSRVEDRGKLVLTFLMESQEWQEHKHIFLLKERWSGRQQNKAGKKSRPGPDSALHDFTGVEEPNRKQQRQRRPSWAQYRSLLISLRQGLQREEEMLKKDEAFPSQRRNAEIFSLFLLSHDSVISFTIYSQSVFIGTWWQPGWWLRITKS